MIKLNALPRGLDEILQLYGNPDADNNGRADPQWWEQNMELFSLPWPMRTSWDGAVVTRQWIHRLVGPALIDALRAIARLVPADFLKLCNCDRFGGIYALRAKRGGGGLSTHSWGIAIDINPHLGPLGGPDNQPPFIVEAFEQRGFVCLAHDRMHMQAAVGY